MRSPRILPMIRNTNYNVRNMSKRLHNAYKCGYQNGQFISNKNNHGRIKKAYTITKSVSQAISKNTTVDDIPYIAGFIGLLTPLPLTSPIFLILGKLTEMTIKKLHKF